MASIYHGRGAAIGLGLETTWGTAVARTNWRPLISSSLTRTIEKVPRPNLRVGAAGAMRRQHYTQVDSAGGSFSIEATYENIGIILEHTLGTSATVTGPPHVHTYTFADDLPVGLTIENNRGTGTSEVFEGCRISTATLACEAGGILTIDAEVIAQTSTTRAGLASTTFGSGDTPILHSHAGTLAFGGSTYDLIDLSLVVNNALSTRMKLGDATTKQPLRADFQSVELSCNVEVDDALYAAFVNDTEGDAVITFTAGSQSFAITVQNAFLTECTDPVSDANVIKQSLKFMGQSDGTDEGLKIVVTNTTSTATGN